MKRAEMAFDPFQLVDKKDRKRFTRRNDRMGLIYLGGHFAAMGVTGYLIYLSLGTVLVLPAMIVHGIVLACLFAPMHECSHGTAFRTRWLNEVVYWLVSIIYVSQPTWYRYRHAVHHTYTQIQGKDPSMVVPSPTTWKHYFAQLTGLRFWYTFPVVITRHSFGSMRDQDSWYVPQSDLPRIYFEARAMLALYVLVAIISVKIGNLAPLIYWLLPRILGEPIQRAARIAEHKGCAEGPDVRTNTRSTRTNPVLQALCWNMPFHSEHHVLPAAPFHQLPALNKELEPVLHPMGDSYIAVDRYVRKHCIVSEAEATRIRRERAQKTMGTDDERWLCHLD